MRAAANLALACAVAAVLVTAGCAAPQPPGESQEEVISAIATGSAVPTAPVGIMAGSDTTAMPDVVGLNLRIAAERMNGVGEGARLFTGKYHGLLASVAYDPEHPVDVGDAVVTTTSPAAGMALHGDDLDLCTGPLAPRKVAGRTVGPWFFDHGALVRRDNDQGCWGCHGVTFCQRCHPGYKMGTAAMTHPPVTVESAVRARIVALYPDKRITVSRVLVSGTNGYAVYLTYSDPAAAISQVRTHTEAELASAVRDSHIGGIGKLMVLWVDPQGRLAATDDVPLR